MAGGTGAPAPAPVTLVAAGRRRGGAGAPTIDPRTVTKFDEITAIPFVFARHPMYPEAHVHMNSTCSDAFLEVGDLFAVTTPPSRVNFVTNLLKTRHRRNPLCQRLLTQRIRQPLPLCGQGLLFLSHLALDTLRNVLRQQL